MQLKSESGDVSIKRADLTDGQISLDDGELQMGNSSFNGDMEITSSNGDVSIQMKKSSVDKTNILSENHRRGCRYRRSFPWKIQQ